jgi:predicted neuraminidase
MGQRMAGTKARLLLALTLVAVLLSWETHLRTGPAALARALMAPKPDPLAQQVPPQGNVQGKVQTRVQAGGALQRVAGGTIPMPDNTPSAHASSLLAMPAGSSAVLSAFWFAGTREGAPDVQIAASQFDRASGQWLPAKYVVNRHTVGAASGFGIRRLGNPVAWLDGSGRMHLFVVATGLGGWAAGRVLHLMQSSAGQDLAQLSFAPVRVLPLSWLWNTSFLVRSAPLPLQDGGMVLPVYFELGIKYPVALRFDAEGNFVGMVRMSARKELLQPTLIANSPTDWLALLRASRNDAHIAVVQTQDGGAHWSDAPDLPLVNPDSSVAALTVSEQQHVLVHNSSPHSRGLLDLSASPNGLEWTSLAPLAHGTDADEYSYPALAWADDDLWVSYTDHRERIAWQRFSAAAAPNARGGKP